MKGEAQYQKELIRQENERIEKQQQYESERRKKLEQNTSELEQMAEKKRRQQVEDRAEAQAEQNRREKENQEITISLRANFILAQEEKLTIQAQQQRQATSEINNQKRKTLKIAAGYEMVKIYGYDYKDRRVYCPEYTKLTPANNPRRISSCDSCIFRDQLILLTLDWFEVCGFKNQLRHPSLDENGFLKS